MPVSTLSNELQEKANKELNEDPSRIDDDLQHIYSWIDKQPHLNVRKEEQWILNFLRCSKFSLQKTKEMLDCFYTMRTLAPEFLGNRDPLSPEIQDILQNGMIVPILKPATIDGPVTCVLRWQLGVPEKNTFITICKVMLMYAEVLLNENDNYRISGLELIEDFEDFSYNYLLQLSPAECKKSLMVVQNAFPVRIKAVHCINTPSFFDALFSLFTPFMSKKLKERIKVHGKCKLEELHKNVSKSVLPIEYGGTAGYCNDLAAEGKKKMESYRDWFLGDSRYCSDESKRPGKPKTSTEVFGVEGSFRQLNID